MSEFWREEQQREREELRRLAIRWGTVLVLLVGILLFVLWRSGAAVEYGASRTDGSTPARYRVHGIVRDEATGQPVPWAELFDDPNGQPPLFHAAANRDGEFELMTVAEPHQVIVRALGYQARTVPVGKPWYLWMPAGEERLEVRLTKETR